MATPARRRISGDDGSSTVELVFVVPALLLLIFSTVQFALWAYGRNVALQAAREGVSSLRLVQPGVGCRPPRGSEAVVRVQVENYAHNLGRESLLAPSAIPVYNPDGDCRTVQVTVRGQAVSLLPGVALTVTRRASGEIERFTPDEEQQP